MTEREQEGCKGKEVREGAEGKGATQPPTPFPPTTIFLATAVKRDKCKAIIRFYTWKMCNKHNFPYIPSKYLGGGGDVLNSG